MALLLLNLSHTLLLIVSSADKGLKGWLAGGVFLSLGEPLERLAEEAIFTFRGTRQ